MTELLERRHCDLFTSAKTVNMFILYANCLQYSTEKHSDTALIKVGEKNPEKICSYPLVISVIGTRGYPLATPSSLPASSLT